LQGLFFCLIFENKKTMEKQEKKGEQENQMSMLDMLSESPSYDIPAPPPPPEEDLPEPEQSGQSEPEFDFSGNGQEKEQPRADKKTQEARARMAVGVIDMITAKGAAAISGEHSANYKMDEDERKDYEKITADFFETFEGDINPKVIWWVTTLTIVGATLYKANEDKKAAAKTEAWKRAKASYQALQQQAEYEAGELASQYQQIQDLKPKEPQRTRFEIDADGLYERDINGVYLKKKDRKDSPAAGVKKIIDEGKEMNMSAGEINRLCREYLYGESN